MDRNFTKLANLYICHAVNWVRKNVYQLTTHFEPDERFMRLLETCIGIGVSAKIDETDVCEWRKQIANQFAEFRMDACYATMKPAFQWLVESGAATEFTDEYESIFPLYGDFFLKESEALAS